MNGFLKKITGDGFVLKSADDLQYAEALCALVQRNQDAFHYIEYTQGLTTLEKAQEAIRSMVEKWENGRGYNYFIFDNADVLVGYVGFKIRSGDVVAEIGYYLDKAATGNGYVSKAIQLLSKVFFENGGHRIEIFCSSGNKASIAVPVRLGFHLDGVMREYAMYNGVWEDVLIYSQLAGEL